MKSVVALLPFVCLLCSLPWLAPAHQYTHLSTDVRHETICNAKTERVFASLGVLQCSTAKRNADGIEVDTQVQLPDWAIQEAQSIHPGDTRERDT